MQGIALQCRYRCTEIRITTARFELYAKHTAFFLNHVSELALRRAVEKSITVLYYEIHTRIRNDMLRIRLLPSKIPGRNPEVSHPGA
ncbi:hypothetical protein D3C75_979930 [compost metagenome]